MAVDSQGTLFQVEAGLGSPTSWLTVDGVTNIRDLRSGTGAEIDITDLSSTAKEFQLGLKDEGSMSLDLINNPTDPGQLRLSALRSSRETGLFRIVVPFGSPSWTLSFSGLVTTFPVTFAVDDVARGSVTVRVSGEIVETT